MIALTLTTAQSNIIIKICEIEIDALNDLLEEGPDDESKFILEQFGATDGDWKEKIAEMRTEFFKILEEPYRLFELDESHISIFRHILFNLEEAEDKDEDCVTVKYPVAVKNLWRKLFMADDWQNMIGATLAN